MAKSGHTSGLRFGNDDNVASQCERWNAEGGVPHSRPSLLCSAILFWLCRRWTIGATRVVAWNVHVCGRNGLARAPKRYPDISLDWNLLCGGSKCADLSYWPLAWRPYFRFGRINCNRICVGITNLWIAHFSASSSGHSKPPKSKSPSPESARVSPEVKDVFKKIHRLMDNEKAQNERLPEPFRSQVLAAPTAMK